MAALLTRNQVRSVDRLAVERYHMTGLVLMENAGRGAADIIRREYGPPGRAIIFCGPGNNGGDGCVIARHLHNAEWNVRLVMAGERGRLSPDAAANAAIVEAMGLPMVFAVASDAPRSAAESIRTDDVVIDALLGTGFQGSVRSPMAELIVAVNAAGRRALVAIDVPSGLDCDEGTPSNATIQADLTVTFVAGKPGFAAPAAASYVGRVQVAEIGVPRELIEAVAAAGG